MKTCLFALCVLLVVSPCLSDTVGDEANRLWTNANSQFRGDHWDQALPLLEKFVRQYATHERVPDAYLGIAWCKAQLKDPAGADAALEEVNKRFAGSKTWLWALSGKLRAAQVAKNSKLYMDTLDSWLRRVPEAPRDLPDLTQGANYDYCAINAADDWFRQNGRAYYLDPSLGMLRPIVDTRNWMLVVPQMANTEALAKQAMGTLTKTFNLLKKDLPEEWQFVQYALMKQSGQVDAAEKFWEESLKEWGDDPRAAALWVLRAQHAQATGDDKTADDSWEEILKQFGGYSSLGDMVYGRLAYLYEKDRFDDFVKLMPQYFKTSADIYGYATGTVPTWLVTMAQRKADQADNSRIEPALKALELYALKDHSARARQILIWTVDLKSRAKQYDEAAALAKQLIDPKQWCAESLNLLTTWAPRDPKLAAVLDEARKKYEIADIDPQSEAGKMLDELRGRIKAEEARFAEELVTTMTGKFPKDPATIAAVKELADYYYAKVVPDLRDKWMDFMVRTYQFHPLTQALLHTQIMAEGAAKRYDRQASALDTMFSRFPPTMANPEYYAWRYGCIMAQTKDAKSALAYSRKHLGAWAAAGDLSAIQRVMHAEDEANRDPKTQWVDNKLSGAGWLAFANSLPDTRVGLHCLANAWSLLYWGQYYPYHYADRIAWDEGKKITERFMAYKSDPEIVWKMAYGDINWLAAKGVMKKDPSEKEKANDPYLGPAVENAKALVAAINARVKDGSKIRDLALRLDLPGIGMALGKAKMVKEVDELATKFKRVTFTQRDQDAIEMMQGFAHGNAEDYIAGAEHLSKLVTNSRWPVEMYGILYTEIYWLNLGKNPGQAQAELEKYLTAITNCQNMVPVLMKEHQGVNVMGALKARYPASNALEQMIKDIEKAKQPPTPAPKK